MMAISKLRTLESVNDRLPAPSVAGKYVFI